MPPCGPPAAAWWPSTPPAASRCSRRPTRRRRGRSRGCTPCSGTRRGGDGRRGGAAGQGSRRHEGDRTGRRRRHRGHRLRLPFGHVRAQRRRPVHLLRQRGVHEHRRPAVRGDAAGGAHGNDRGGRTPIRGTRSVRARTSRRWRWRTGSPTSRPPRWPTCTTSRPRSPGPWRSTVPVTSTSWCPARSAGVRPVRHRDGWPGWRRRRASSPSSRPSTARSSARRRIRRPAPVRSTCGCRAASPISSTGKGTRPGPTSSPPCRRWPTATSVATASRGDRGGAA